MFTKYFPYVDTISDLEDLLKACYADLTPHSYKHTHKHTKHTLITLAAKITVSALLSY